MDVAPGLEDFSKSISESEDSEDLMKEENEVSDFGAKYSTLSDEDMQDYLQKTKEGKKNKRNEIQITLCTQG